MRPSSKVVGLPAPTVDAIKVRAQNVEAFNKAYEKRRTKPQEFGEMQRRRDAKPDLYRMWKFPSVWERDVHLYQHVDVIMHLLFLGVVKTVVRKIMNWAKARNKNASLLRYASGVLDSVSSLGVPWCKAFEYRGGKLGGWVSENYLAMTRLAKWFYSALGDLYTERAYVQPDKPVKDWKCKELEGWLKARGLKYSGNKPVLIARVNGCMRQPGGPPELKSVKAGPVENALNVINALVAMISRLMATKVDSHVVADCERHIKVFLNAFHAFDLRFDKKDDIPSWISSYNFMCLLNLPSVMERFGPLRLLFEGGKNGEGVLPPLKDHLSMGLRKNWPVNVITNILRDKSMDYLKDEMGDSGESGGQRDYRRYRSCDPVVRALEEGKPVSAVQLVDGRYGCVLLSKQVMLLDSAGFVGTINGMSYHKWTTESHVIPFQPAHVQHSLILLPQLCVSGLHKGGGFPGHYAAVDSDWNELQSDGSFALPQLDLEEV